MSTPSLVNACPVCGAEESLDALLLRMIDDDSVRRLIAEVLTASLPLGGMVVRYLRLHKPAKQRLRMSTVGKLLAELVPDIQRVAIERKGRIWAVSGESWRAAFQVVFDAAESGSLTLPLEGNGYLYAVLARTADREEGAEERERTQAARQRTVQAGARTVEEVIAQGMTSAAVAARDDSEKREPGADPAAAALALEIKARLAVDLAARKARQNTSEAQP